MNATASSKLPGEAHRGAPDFRCGWTAVLLLLLMIGLLRAGWGRWTRSAHQPLPSPAFVVDVNRATAAELQALPNIGTSLSQRIVEYRRKHGPYTSLDGLLSVHGMGPKTLAEIAPMLRVAPELQASSQGELASSN